MLFPAASLRHATHLPTKLSSSILATWEHEYEPVYAINSGCMRKRETLGPCKLASIVHTVSEELPGNALRIIFWNNVLIVCYVTWI